MNRALSLYYHLTLNHSAAMATNTTATNPILRILAEEINNAPTQNYCGGVETTSRFAVRMDGDYMRIDMVRVGGPMGTDTFDSVLAVYVGQNEDGPCWQAVASWTDKKSDLGLDFGPWEVEAISELTKYVRGVLRRDYHEVAMQVAAPLVNLTPHPVVVLGENDEVLLTIPVSGLPVPRASKTTEVVAEVEMNGVHIPLVRTRFGAVENLPEPVKGTAYIVSLIVKQACPDRRDLRIVEDVVRDGSVIKGCRAFGI